LFVATIIFPIQIFNRTILPKLQDVQVAPAVHVLQSDWQEEAHL